MGILKDLFLIKRKQPTKRFVATVRGHAPWGLGVIEYFYNMYEYKELQGGQYYEIPDHVDYSTKLQVRGWLYGGRMPIPVLNCDVLIEEVNKKIKKRTKQDQLICEIKNEGEVCYSQAYEMDREIEKAARELRSTKSCI